MTDLLMGIFIGITGAVFVGIGGAYMAKAISNNFISKNFEKIIAGKSLNNLNISPTEQIKVNTWIMKDEEGKITKVRVSSMGLQDTQA